MGKQFYAKKNRTCNGKTLCTYFAKISIKGVQVRKPWGNVFINRAEAVKVLCELGRLFSFVAFATAVEFRTVPDSNEVELRIKPFLDYGEMKSFEEFLAEKKLIMRHKDGYVVMSSCH